MADGKSIEIGIYLLKRIQTPQADEHSSCMVAASSEKEARTIANQELKADGYIWTDAAQVEAVFAGTAVDGVYGLLIASKEQ